MARAFPILPVLQPEISNALKGILRRCLFGFAFRYRVYTRRQQLARLCVALPGQHQRHIGIPSKGHELGAALNSVSPAPNLSTRRRDPKEQSPSVTDLVGFCFRFDPLDLYV